MSKQLVNVSIGLIFNRNRVLVGWRNADQHQGDKAEFPGGKVELNETPQDACIREIREEVGVTVERIHLFDVIQHEYQDLIVCLNIFHTSIDDQQCLNIKQPWTWYTRTQLADLNFPKANDGILKRLSWPKQIKIAQSHQNIVNADDQCIYFRSDFIDEIEFLTTCLKSNYETKLIVHHQLWPVMSEFNQDKIFAVQFKHSELMQLNNKFQFEKTWQAINKIASCHDVESVAKALEFGFDAIFLSPVLATASHPDQKPLGWDQFHAIAKNAHIPVYALGGLAPNMLETAEYYGAYGVAGIQNF